MINKRSPAALLSLLVGLFVASCATTKPWYDKTQLNWRSAAPPDSVKLDHTIFLIGDVGNPEKSGQEPTLKLLQEQIFHKDSLAVAMQDTSNTSRKEDAVIFLGDNIYETGMPEPGAADRKEKERRLTEQLKILKGFKGRTIMTPGNHDWGGEEGRPDGLQAVIREEQFAEAYMDSADVYLPSNGCGGPEEVHLGNNIVIIVIDSQWWLQRGYKPVAPDNGCSITGREDLITQVKDILLRNKGKNILIAEHHPLFSNGVHGGHFTLKDYIFPLTLLRDHAYVPLPVIGSIYPLMRQYGVSPQDISNKNYQQLKRGLLSVLEGEKNVVFAAGHEHALQFNRYNELNHVIAGAGSKSTRLIKGNGALFTHGTKGFSKVNYYSNGQCWLEFWEPVGDGTNGTLVYRTPLYAIPPTRNAEVREEKQIQYKDSSKVLAAGDEYKAGAFKRAIFGEHYRDSWATPVKVNYLDPSVFAGGLTPVKMGGGHQTTSLQLSGKDGNTYQFRLIEKDPVKLLDEGLRKTFAEDIVQDQISSSNPYSALIVPVMAKAIGIYYAQPQLVYMPYSRLLGPYIQQAGGRLGYIEAKADENLADFKSFGNAANAISTLKVYEKVEGDNDNEIDQQMFVKARLFDILIGDWDRHEDQWRWGEFKKDKGAIYRPIPRDRDQAFAKYDGLLPELGSKVIPDIQSFEYKIKNVAAISIAARNLDRNFLNKLDKASWLAAATELKAKLADNVIETAVKKMPPEVFSRSGPEIIAKLKSRRDQLTEVADKYYRILAKTVTITGTDKNEFFDISQQKDATSVKVYKIDKNGKVEQKIYDRVFKAGETNELDIYALKGQDSLVSKGDGPIKIRFIGGPGKDDITTTATTSRMIVYDSGEKNTIRAGSSTSLRISDNAWVNAYDRDAFEYNRKGIIPYFDYNHDDGVFIGAGFTVKHRGFRKEPYAYEQGLAGNYAPQTGAYTIRYRGAFYSLFAQNTDLVMLGTWNGPKYTFSYYGQGNSSPNVGDDNLYFRTRTKDLILTAFAQHRFSKEFKAGIGPGYEYYRVEKPANRYVSSSGFPEKQEIESPGNFGTVRSFTDISLVDNPVFPAAGLKWRNEANYFNEFGNTAYKFVQLKTVFSIYLTPNFGFPVTAAIRAGGATNIGDYKFYQANSLGSNNFLRGYRNDRFSGRSFLFENTELRFKLSDLRNYIFTGNLGLFGFFDTGRVYSANPESSAWHDGYGPGAWINFYNKFMFSAAYGISKEGEIVTLKGGISF